MTKRISAFLLALALAAGLAMALIGCSNNSAVVTHTYGAETPELLAEAVERAVSDNDAEAFFALMALSQVSDTIIANELGLTRDEFVREATAEFGQDIPYIELTFFEFEELDELGMTYAESLLDDLDLTATDIRFALFDGYETDTSEQFDMDVFFVELDGRWFFLPD